MTNTIYRLLGIPYRSQEAQDAKRYGNDCGIACVAMIHEYRYPAITRISIDALAAMRPPAPFSKPHDLVVLGRQVGLNLVSTDASLKRFLGIQDIIREIDGGNPCILLVCYQQIPDRLNKKYRGGHYILAVGFDQKNEQLIVHDPDWYGQDTELGANRRYSFDVIRSAMSGCRVGDTTYFSIAQQGVIDRTGQG